MDRKAVSRCISTQPLQGLAMGKPEHGAALLQTMAQEINFLPTKTTTWFSVQQTRIIPNVVSATSQESQAESFKVNPRGNSGQ